MSSERAPEKPAAPLPRRVAEGDRTPPPSQNRTRDSRLIRLLHSNLRPHALPPKNEQVGIAAGDAPQPVHRRSLPASEPRVLPLRPLPEGLVEGAEHLNAPRAIEPLVVVQPAPHHRVRKASQILQALVIPGGRHPPAADGLPDRRRSLGADRRQEAHEVSPPPVLRPSRLEGVAEEVERDVFVLPRPVVILAVDDPGLRGMKLQTAFRQATPDRLQHSPRLRLAPAMDERSSSGGDLHPSALPEPDVRLSPHPAPTLQPQTPAPPIAGWPASSAGVSGPFPPPALPGFNGVESEEVGLSPFLRPLAQTARAVFPQAAFLCDRLR